MSIRFAAAVLMLCICEIAIAQAVPTADQVRSCRLERDDNKRLACYDALAQRLSPPRASAPPAAQAPATQASGAATGVALPSASARDRAAQSVVVAEAPDTESTVRPSKSPAGNNDDSDESLTATVVRVFEQPRGEHVVELDNGQMWQQERASRYFPVDEGDEITVRKQFFGGYRLVTTSGKGYRVERLR